MHPTETLIRDYYAAFNRADWDAMCALLAPDVAHDINQGGRETGVAAFRAFLSRMQRSYREELRDIAIMVDRTGTRAAAEFTVHGEYLADDAGLPPAHGQRYILPAGAFLAVSNGRITRVTMHYNLADWIAQVGG